MINRFVPWFGLALLFVALCVSALLEQRWFDVCVCLGGFIIVALGTVTARHEGHELRWKNDMLEAQDRQIRVMRQTRRDHH